MVNRDGGSTVDPWSKNEGGSGADPWGLRSFALIPLLIVFIVLCLSGCSGNSATPSTPTSTSPVISNLTAIRIAFGEGCIQLARKHPASIPTYLSDLTLTQTSLDSGKVPYAALEALAIKNIKASPEEMVLIQPAIDEIASKYFPQASTIPVKGTQQYDVVEAAITSCRDGLNAVVAAGVK